MIAVWYFDGELPCNPSHVYTGSSADAALEALCDRFGAHHFDAESELAAMQRGSYVIELPCDSRCAVMVTHPEPLTCTPTDLVDFIYTALQQSGRCEVTVAGAQWVVVQK